MFVESRRDFLKQIGALAALAATPPLVGVLLEGCSSTPQESAEAQALYKELYAYRNKELPGSLVLKLGQDLASHSAYPALVQSGQLLVDNQKNPQNIAAYDQVLSNPKGPIKMRFMDLGNDVAQIVDQGSLQATNSPITLKKAGSNETVTFQGVQSQSTDLNIALNNGLLDVKASVDVFRLMIAKEASHPFYYSQARTALLTELRGLYQLTSDQALENILMASALSADDPRLKMPRVSRLFNGLLQFIDYAGFGHITLDLGRIQVEGRLNSKDQEILDVNLSALKEAQSRGVVIQDPSDKKQFRWKDGVGPFSMPWFDVMNAVYSKFGFKTV